MVTRRDEVQQVDRVSRLQKSISSFTSLVSTAVAALPPRWSIPLGVLAIFDFRHVGVDFLPPEEQLLQIRSSESVARCQGILV